MVGGESIDLAHNYENDEGGDGGIRPELVDSGTKCPDTISNPKSNAIMQSQYAILFVYQFLILITNDLKDGSPLLP